MSIFPLRRWVNCWAGEDAFAELVDRVAARCQATVWSRVAWRVIGMDPYQAGGYIRARAALVVHREIQIATAGQSPLSADCRRRLFRQVSEHAVRDALTQLAAQRAMRRAA
jgi:hypothetical protein